MDPSWFPQHLTLPCAVLPGATNQSLHLCLVMTQTHGMDPPHRDPSQLYRGGPCWFLQTPALRDPWAASLCSSAWKTMVGFSMTS